MPTQTCRWHTSRRMASTISARVPHGVTSRWGKYASTSHHTIRLSSISSCVNRTDSKSTVSMGNDELMYDGPKIGRPLMLLIEKMDGVDGIYSFAVAHPWRFYSGAVGNLRAQIYGDRKTLRSEVSGIMRQSSHSQNFKNLFPCSVACAWIASSQCSRRSVSEVVGAPGR